MQDELLFESSEEKESRADDNSDKPLETEELKKRAEIVFHSKVLSFGFVAMAVIVVMMILLILADFYAQKNNLSSELIKECLSLLTYVATAALGFIFGASTK